MSPGHLSVPVHAMHAMSQGHPGTFTFGFKTPLLSMRMDWDWKYFHVPGTSITPCSCYACRTCLRDIQVPLYSDLKLPVSQAAWIEIDKIFMSPGHLSAPIHVMHARDRQEPLHSVSKHPVCQGAWIEIDNIFMSPGHLSVPVHAMHAMSQGHTGTFAICFKTPRLSRRMDWDW